MKKSETLSTRNRKLALSAETLHRLESGKLVEVAGGVTAASACATPGAECGTTDIW